MSKNQRAQRLQQLGRALQSQIEDPLTCDQCQALLPDYGTAENADAPPPSTNIRWAAVRHHLALCPYCTAAYQQMNEWLTAGNQDAIPGAATYPAFDLSFLEASAPAAAPFTWPFALLEKRRQQGVQWLHEAASGLYLLFTPAPALAGAGWAVKSGADDTLLARTVLGEDEYPGWEIEATVFATSADHCRVEVSLYAFAPLPDNLSGIVVTLHDGVTDRFALTDANGLAEFAAVPRERIAVFVLRVNLPSAP